MLRLHGSCCKPTLEPKERKRKEEEKVTPVARYQHECELVNLMLITDVHDAT